MPLSSPLTPRGSTIKAYIRTSNKYVATSTPTHISFCHMPKACQNCGAKANADGTKLKKCQKCKKIRYCSIPCQKDDRDRHRPECRVIRKAKELKNHGLVSLSMEGETKSASSPTTIAINQVNREDEDAHSTTLQNQFLSGTAGAAGDVVTPVNSSSTPDTANAGGLPSSSSSSSILTPPLSCTNCGKKQVINELPLKVCTCKNARYCPGGQCQKAHWKKHKALHKKMTTPEATKPRTEDEKKHTEILCNAVKKKNMRLIELLLAKNANVNGVSQKGWSPLLLACDIGFTPAVEILLMTASIDVNQARTNDGCTPLFMACQNGHAPVVELLLAASEIALNQARTDIGATPLYNSCELGHAPIVELLLAASDIDVNQARTDDGSTPLFMACHNRHTPIVKLLLAVSGIDVNKHGHGKRSPLSHAQNLNHTEIVQLLIDASGALVSI